MTAVSRDALVEALKAAANRALPRPEPYMERAHAERHAKGDAVIHRAIGRWVPAGDACTELSSAELVAVTNLLDDLAEGRVELVLRASGGYEVRPVPVGRRRVA